MRFVVTILGCNSAKPANGRHPSAQILNIREQFLLIDCGEGTQLQCNKYGIAQRKINHIFISHLHGDHVFGLPGLLTSFSLNNRLEPLHIFSPKGLEEMMLLVLKNSGSRITYPIHFHEVETSASQLVFENSNFEVHSIPLDHRIETSGYLFVEKNRSRKIIASKIEEYQIPFHFINAIKEGGDFTLADGRIISNAELTSDPPINRSYAYCSDTTYQESVVPIVKGVDLLYHEATYLHDRVEQAGKYKHSTAKQAAMIAQQAQVKQLILGHYSSRYYDLNPFLEEASAVFENTVLGQEGEHYEVPLKYSSNSKK